MVVDGTEIWVAAENAYNERVSGESGEPDYGGGYVIDLVRARNANEMFRVFSKFNALFVRPKVCGLSFYIYIACRAALVC